MRTVKEHQVTQRVMKNKKSVTKRKRRRNFALHRGWVCSLATQNLNYQIQKRILFHVILLLT
jgi:hypothetical protein